MGSDPRPVDQAPRLVLVVENDESNRELFQVVLERAGMHVIPARDVEEARTLIADLVPDVVVTDVRMPLVDGATFVRVLRSNHTLEGVPILLVTGFLSPTDDLNPLQDCGPVDALLKPFKPDVLVRSVQLLLKLAASRAAKSSEQAASRWVAELAAQSNELKQRSQQLIDRAAQAILFAKTVLLVEDDGAFRYAMRRMLRGAGATVVETSNLENALTALNQRADIDAVVADVVLPDGLAPEGLKRFEQLRQLPVLYVTGYSDQLLRNYGLSARDRHLLMKPFDGATLVSRLAALSA